MTPSEYLDALKAKMGVESDYALAKRLEISNARIAEIRHEKRAMPLDIAFKMAITLGLNPAQVVADLEAQREKNQKRKAFWSDFLRAAGVTFVLHQVISKAIELAWLSTRHAIQHSYGRLQPAGR